MKCQILLSRENKKTFSKSHQLKFLPSMQSVIITGQLITRAQLFIANDVVS